MGEFSAKPADAARSRERVSRRRDDVRAASTAFRTDAAAMLNTRPTVLAQHRAVRVLAQARPKPPAPIQRAAKRTGIPDRLKTGMEAVSSLSLDDVRVAYRSSKPARIGALAYAQGSDIHLAPGHDRHLAHELGHVVQQKQGRVRETIRVAGVPVNDHPALERDATALRGRAHRWTGDAPPVSLSRASLPTAQRVAQRFLGDESLGRYTHAASVWADAARAVAGFDASLDKMAKSHAGTDSGSDAHKLRANVLAKAVKASTTIAGEGAEPILWTMTGDMSAKGPGGGAGIDITPYNFLSSGSSTRGKEEVKTVSSIATFKAGIKDAVGAKHAGFVKMTYNGSRADIDALHKTDINIGGTACIFCGSKEFGAVSITVECADGQTTIGVIRKV